MEILKTNVNRSKILKIIIDDNTYYMNKYMYLTLHNYHTNYSPIDLSHIYVESTENITFKSNIEYLFYQPGNSTDYHYFKDNNNYFVCTNKKFFNMLKEGNLSINNNLVISGTFTFDDGYINLI